MVVSTLHLFSGLIVQESFPSSCPEYCPFYMIFVEKSRKFFFGEKVFFQKFPGRVGGSREYDRAEEEGTPPPHPPPPPSIRKEESEREELVTVGNF